MARRGSEVEHFGPLDFQRTVADRFDGAGGSASLPNMTDPQRPTRSPALDASGQRYTSNHASQGGNLLDSTNSLPSYTRSR